MSNEVGSDPFAPRDFNIDRDWSSSLQASNSATAGFWKFGRPQGTSDGVVLIFDKQKAKPFQADLLYVKDTEDAKKDVFRPTPEFVEPEMRALLKATFIVTALNATYKTITGSVMDFSTTWMKGYQIIFDAITALDDANQGIELIYIPKFGGGIGTYDPKIVNLTDQQKTARTATNWLSKADAYKLIPTTSISSLVEYSNVRRAWEHVEARKADEARKEGEEAVRKLAEKIKAQQTK